MRLATLSLIGVGVLSLITVSHAAAAATDSGDGFVYVMTNKAEANSVLVFHRSGSGSLERIQEAPTQGLGTGVTADPFMSEGSLFLRADNKLLFAVNPGSGDVTAFVVTTGGLRFGSKISSGGAFPVSVTAYGGTVYVLNQLGISNISGFTVSDSGKLAAIPGSAHELAGGALAQPAQISFSPDGTQLLVTEKGTDQIDVFEVNSDGSASGPVAQPSSGHTPFGFAFGPSSSVIVSEAERRLPKAATTSSYVLSGGGLAVVSPTVANMQTAACWVTVTGSIAWVVNTGTSTISAYEIGGDGHLTLSNAVAANTGMLTGPIDLAATKRGDFLYVLESNVGVLAGYKISGSSLTPIVTRPDLPLSIQGIAVQ